MVVILLSTGCFLINVELLPKVQVVLYCLCTPKIFVLSCFCDLS